MFKPDQTDLTLRPGLDVEAFDPGTHRAVHESATGQAIFGFYGSRFGTALLTGAILTAPSRSPVVAGEPFLYDLIGDDAFADPVKQYTGKVIKWAVEQIGGRWVRYNGKVPPSSLYKSGSLYTFHEAPTPA
jgi:hypothetical protein